ncbi:MAG: class I SAM-dependent methyltransferase [Lachnospiraceae bacterium]|nr:class I SAM-dependent methyltransferase [Lachnospiraceae bacterium]
MGNLNRQSIPMSERLMMVFRLLDMGNVICDVGCDHGYLPIKLIESGNYNKAIAMDINEGPLNKASENIDKFGLSDCIETRLSDGVKSLRQDEADAVSICGMGGNVMMHIFDDGKEVLSHLDKIVIQPQSEYMTLHNYILLQGYAIVDEDIVFEDGKYYFAWKLKYTGESLSDADGTIKEKPGYYHSVNLLEQGNETYRAYLEYHLKNCNKAIENIKANSSDNARLEQLLAERDLVRDSVREYYS